MTAFLRRLIKPLLLKVFPQHVLSTLAGEWHLFTIRRRLPALRLRYADSRELLVNIGAGSSGKVGWVNVDGFQQSGINCLLDCRAPMPFPDGSVQGLFSEHFFEHLRYPEEAGLFLRECRRVMQPGAVLRIIVPDGESYVKAYIAVGWKEMAGVRPLNEHQYDPWGLSFRTKMEVVNEMFRQGGEHFFAYDYETLELLLRESGFERISRSAYGESADARLLLDLAYRQPGSLYVEAIR
jgi:predicted SAM-dependent methyltransferase